MTILPKSPLERLVYFQDEVDRLFHLLFDNSPMSSSINHSNYPRVDVYAKGNEINFEFEVPDINKEDIVLSISNDLIVVEGVKKEKMKSGIKNYICMERVYGKFQKVVKVPSIVDTKHARAEYHDGILTVILPKIEERRNKSKKIKIT